MFKNEGLKATVFPLILQDCLRGYMLYCWKHLMEIDCKNSLSDKF